MNCSVITDDPPSSSWGGRPKSKSLPQSTKGHHGILPSSPSDLCRLRYQSRTALVPGNCERTKSGSLRYIQKSCSIPTHSNENVGMIWVSEEGYRLWVRPSGIRE